MLVYSILDCLPKDFYVSDKNDIKVSIISEQDLLKYIELISDLITIVKTWKTTELRINDVEIGLPTEFRYAIDFLFEKHNQENGCFRSSVDDIRKKYTKRKTITTAKPVGQTIVLSRNYAVESLEKVIDKYIEKYGRHKEIAVYSISPYDRVVLIEDNLIVDFRLVSSYWTRKDDKRFEPWDYPHIMIQELTKNILFKFVYADFRRQFQCDHVGLDFYPFHGPHYYIDEIDNSNNVNMSLPELRLMDRYREYTGERYHFVILRMEKPDGNSAFGVGYTKNKVQSFILNLCQELEVKNSRSLELNGASCLPYSENKLFIEAFLLWKGQPKRWRLENKFSYFYEDRLVINDSDLLYIPGEVVKAANDGVYEGREFGSYNKPINRWKSEELVYNITKKLYKDYQVIYQYEPYYLSTDKGRMSYDIYICGLKIAIEYQGKQHFEPVPYFGGPDSFAKQKERDELKAKRSIENGVKLVYVNYWEDITPELIKEKIDNAILGVIEKGL